MGDILVPGGGTKRVRRSVAKEIQRLLGTPATKGDERTWAQVLAMVAVRQAYKGNYPFFREVVERSDGKVPDRIAGAEGGPIGLEAIIQTLDKVYPKEAMVEVHARVARDDDDPPMLEHDPSTEEEEA